MNKSTRIPAFALQDIMVRYGRTIAVDSVSFSAPPGSLTALLGPNGAGKSSLLRVVSTAERPGSGRIHIFGHNVATEPMRARRRLGLVFQERTLDKELSIDRNLWFHAHLFGMRRTDAAARIDHLLTLFGLTANRRKSVEKLSGGTARRVELVRALLHRPDLLILDEPTTGLDPESRRLLWRDLLRLRDEMGVTTLYSTHYMDETEHADNILIMAGGRVGQSGSPAELKEELDSSGIRLSTTDNERALQRLRLAGFDVRWHGDDLLVRCVEPETRIAEVITISQVSVTAVSVSRPSMDDVYLAATSGERTRS